MSVADENVGPRIVIHVEESATPTEEARVQSELRRVSRVLELVATEITIERMRVAGKIGFNDIQVSVTVIISRGNAHSSLRFAVCAQSATRLNADLFEGSVLQVLVEQTRLRIVRHVNVWPTIVVEVSHQHSKPKRSRHVRDARLLGNISERSIAVVVIQDVLIALQSWRTARDHDALVQARTRFRHRRSLQVEINVV